MRQSRRDRAALSRRRRCSSSYTRSSPSFFPCPPCSKDLSGSSSSDVGACNGWVATNGTARCFLRRRVVSVQEGSICVGCSDPQAESSVANSAPGAFYGSGGAFNFVGARPSSHDEAACWACSSSSSCCSSSPRQDSLRPPNRGYLRVYQRPVSSRAPWGLLFLVGLFMALCVSSGVFAYAKETAAGAASDFSDCPLMDSSCLLNYSVSAPDYFYRRRLEAPIFPISVRTRPEGQQQQQRQQQLGEKEQKDRQQLPQGGSVSKEPLEKSADESLKEPKPLRDPLEAGGGRGSRPLLESNGLICEDDERVEDFGVKCRLIARSLGGRLGCEKRLIDISPDGRLPANIPAFSRVADACPMTCGLCEECAPGCALWFLGNTLCDEVCNNAACQFDGGDCWSADCVVGPWAEWSPCSVTCGGPGTERRRREVKSRAKQGGAPCPKLEVLVVALKHGKAATQTCRAPATVRWASGQSGLPALNLVGLVSAEWTEWSACGASCGGGQQTRQRSVLSPPVEDGEPCPELLETRECNTFSCDGGCHLGDWSEWTECSKPCEGGSKTRTRTVIAIEPDTDCPPSTQTAPCNLHECAVDCVASEWSQWTPCDVPCGVGTQRRMREVLEEPKGAGEPCPPLDQLRPCDRGPCTVDCILSEWSPWGECSHPCGLGEQRRTRHVVEVPSEKGTPCGALEETRPCGGHCAPTCILSDWTEWASCSALCQQVGATNPTTTRSRVVLLEAPDCPNPSSLSESLLCSSLGFRCDVDCQVGPWSQWSACSKPCGGGSRRRAREITRVPQGNGKACGELAEEAPCAMTSCETIAGQAVPDCVWGEWSEYGPCDATCGPGRRRSTRVVLAFPKDASGRVMQHLCPESERFEACQGPPCPVDCQVTAWGAWSSCTATCGGGQQQRQRSVVRQPANGGRECPVLTETQVCGSYPCPTDCEMSPWSEWTTCSAACGEGQMFRSRRITSAASVDPPGLACGATREEAACFSPAGPCPSDCELGDWSEWSDCSALCGGGTRQRFRSVEAFEVGGGRPCTGSKEEAEACNMQPCEPFCPVSEWSEWTECSSPCLPQDGSETTRRRYREVLREPPPHARGICPPVEEVQRGCNADIPCPIDCEYTPWTSWGDCEGECDVGQRRRARRILSEAQFGGEPCAETEQTADCSLETACIRDCLLSNWSEWGPCSATCGGGYKQRHREVVEAPINGGDPCESLEEFEPCAEFSCFGSDCKVSEWGEWGACSKECGGGVHTRERQVLMPRTGNGADCPELQQRRGCGLHRCPGVPCEDSPDVPLLTGVECKVLLAMGCHRRLQELAEENNQPFPEDLPPEVRVSDACPKTCGVCAECAPGCQLRDLGNRHCDEPCNNEACQMDLGDCGGDCALGKLPPGLRLEPATSMMTEGQTLIASCADPDMRLSPFSSMRQIAVTCVGKGEFALEPPDLALKRDEEEALLLPPCAPDPCPFISVSGFTGDAAVFNGIFLRGDPHGSLPRFLQDTLSLPAHFLWAQETQTKGGRHGRRLIWRITQADPNTAAQNAGLTAAATGGDCAAEAAGGDAAVGCTDSWEVGVAGTENRSKPQRATFKCIDEETRTQLEAQQLETEDPEEEQAVPQGPPVTVVAGVEMVCEDQQEVQEKSGKSCEALKKMLKCDFLLADAGVDLPSFLPPDATLALACPQTCGLCKQCARGCPLWFLGNRHCDPACNVAACQFDKGDCGGEAQVPAAPHQEAEAADEDDEEEFVELSPHSTQQQQQEDEEEGEEDPATACEDDPQVKAMGFTCKVLYAVAEGTPEGCNSRLQDLRPDEALPPGVPPITRVKDACPKTCRACDVQRKLQFAPSECSCDLHVATVGIRIDPDRLRRPGARAADSASCQDDPMVTEMGYSCKVLLAVAEEEGEGCEARLIDLKPDQTLPPGIPHQTRVKDACPKTCNACDDPTRLQRPSNQPGAACTDFEFVGEAGSSCKLLLTLAQSQGLGGCSAPLSALLEQKHWPQGTPSDITLGDACPHTCDYCEESVLMRMRPPVEEEPSCLGGCCDNKMVEQETGYTCRQIKDFLNGDCSVELESLSSAPLPPEVPKGATLRDACPYTCGACPAQQCVDNPMVQQMGYSCDMLIAAAEGRGGCEALLSSLSGEPLPAGVPPTTRVRDACLKSCNACPPLFAGGGGPEAAAATGGEATAPDCFDDGRLPQLGYSCAMLLDFASKGCETTLGELLPQSLSLPRHLHRHDMIKDFCPKTCGLCGSSLGGGGAVDGAGRRRGCRNNPMVERAGLSCALLVKASPLGCNAKLADLSDDPLPPGVPPSATVRDACMLDCGGCIDVPTCFDGFQNGDEEGIDCGGRCRPCAPCDPSPLKALGEGVIQEGRGTAHGATRRLSCRAEFVRVAGRNGEEVICQDGTFSKPKLRCEPRTVTVQYIKAYIRNAGDLQYGAVPALFAALSSALRVQPPDELRLLAVGLDRRNDGLSASRACEDDPRVAEMGYSCAMMEAFCDSKLHDLAAAQKKQLPEWLPKEAKVKDACRKTCGGCDNRRRLQAISGSPLSSAPLLIDAGVLWTRTAVPFSSLLTDDLPERFLSALKQQFIQQGVTLIDPTDKSLVSAAMALTSRPFAFAIEGSEQRRLPIAHWEGGFGSYSPASHSKAVFAAAGLPIPSSQAVDLPHILDRDGRRPGPPSYASVDYSFGEAAPVHLPLPPGVSALRGACFDPLSYRSDANSCCSLQEELQVFVDGPCGALLYGRRLTQETVTAFCEKPVEGRYCWASFLSRVDAHKRRNGAACSLVQAVEAVLEAWCYKDPTSSSSRYCFAQVEDALEAADLRSLGSKTSNQLDDICGEKSCFRSNLRYLDNMTLLQTSWQLLHATIDEGRQGNVSASQTEISRTSDERVPEASATRRLQGEGLNRAGAVSQGFHQHTRRVLDARERAQHHMQVAASAAAVFSGLQEQIEANTRTPLERGLHSQRAAPRRRLGTLSRFQGPLTETLEEGLNLVCTKVENDYCQQTLVLLAQESPIRTPSLLLEPCASRCFVPLTGAVGAIVEAYGERYRDPWHSLLGSVMRAYGRFYCVTNERGDFCGRHFFDRYRAANPHKVAAQGLELPLPDCQCPHSFLQDGQCDPECYNEACGWDGRDCLPSSMFAQLHAAVSSLVDPTCSLYHPDFECGAKCFKQYETARGVGGSGCCLGMGLDILGAVAAAEAAHPLGDVHWKVRRTVAFAEQICGAAADRTCSLGEPRPLLHVELRVVGLNSQVTLTDAGKVDEIFRALGTALTRKLGLVERDIARHFSRPDPRGITLEFVLDAGRDHAARVAQLLRQPVSVVLLASVSLKTGQCSDTAAHLKPIEEAHQPVNPTAYVGWLMLSQHAYRGIRACVSMPQSLMNDLEAAARRQLGRLSLAAYLDTANGLLGVEFVPDSLAEEQISSPAAGLGPLPPKRNDEGLHELPLQLPPEPCTEASLASLTPRYAALERPKLSDKGDPESIAVACSLGYLPTRGHGADSDRAICDNGKWVLEGGLDCRRTCNGSPDAALHPKGAYIVSSPDWSLNGRAAPRSLQTAAERNQSPANFTGTTTSNGTNGVPHGSALFVRCANGFAAGRGQEGSWLNCIDGEWRLQRPTFTCHRLCPEFEQLGSAYVVTGEGQHQGDEREVSCSRGYYPQRRTHRLVCSEGSWPALPFRCSRAMTPDLREGVGGFQKILQQMFSREGILGFIAFSILILAATLIVVLCWLFCCRGRAHRRQRERAEALQALKLAGVPMSELAAVARARLCMPTESSCASSVDESNFSSSIRSNKKRRSRKNSRSDCSATNCQEMVDFSRRIPSRPPGDAVVPPPSEAAPTGRSSQRDPDESTPVPEWLTEERVLPAQAVRRAADPRCYSAAPASLSSLRSAPDSSFPCTNSCNNRAATASSGLHQLTPLPGRTHEASSEDTDAEVELMHSREEEAAIASLQETAAAKES
ncbi:thrombospondin type 1 domain-containing protein, putative [Eimeria brunetti]|uniref:Thrombospondin type 1 domain-containing protein, putative n=1 Tax=Eimeria brunetti TaxID=51314 RepID=U6L9G0_9EIME|nr:thrombospondin type 1 domain-containing protein, putative [Eimeria brunetti]